MSENRQRPHKATPPGRPTAAPYTQRPQELGSAGRHALPSILRLIVLVLAALSLSSIPFIPPATTAQAATVGFTRKTIFGTTSPGGSLFAKPTTLAIGPDNRLYVGQQNGYIHALTLDANKNVTAVQVISTIYNTPNKNDDGTVATGVVGRTQLGLAFDPASTAASRSST